MTPKNGASTDQPADDAAAAATAATAPPVQTARRRGRPRGTKNPVKQLPLEGAAASETATSPSGSPASPTSAAAKSTRGRKKASKPKPPSQEDFTTVGEIVHLAYGEGGKDAIAPQDLINTWQARINAWNRVHGITA
jgi:hypothetical protein